MVGAVMHEEKRNEAIAAELAKRHAPEPRKQLLMDDSNA